MATLSQSRKEEIAKQLRVAATWVGGPRVAVLTDLASEIEGIDQPEEPAAPEAPVETPATPAGDKGKAPKQGNA